MAWYKTGSVTIVQGQTSVSGTGTRFAANARVGDAFRGPDGLWYEVVNIASEVTLGIYPAYQGASVTANTNYVIAPMQGYVKDSADRLRKITDSIADISSDVAEARASAEAAALSETNAASSESSALASKNAAGVSETNAKASETAAAASQVAAKTSETNSKTSETNAKTSETNAKASETAANTSKNAAAASATAAAGSQTAAGNSATAAATSESNALASKNAATASQTAAAASQTASKTSETNAKTSETNASTSATQAANSATQADGSRTAAATSATLAQQWAVNPVDQPVSDTRYSSYHWATKAKESADAAGAVTGPRLTSIATAVMAVNDMLIADTATTMTKIATSSSGRTVLGGTPSEGLSALNGLAIGQYGFGATAAVGTSPESLDQNTLPNGVYRVDVPAAGFRGLPQAAYGVWTNRLNTTVAVSQIALNYNTSDLYVRNDTGQNFNLMLRQGSFGLGTAQTPTITDLTATWNSGYYVVPVNGTGLPPEAAAFGGVFQALRVNFGILITTSVGTANRKMWTGVRPGATGEVTWKEMLGAGDYGIGGRVVAANANLNTMLDAGNYWTPVNTSNGPYAGGTGNAQGYLEVIPHTTTGYLIQRFTSINAPTVTWLRRQGAGVWSDWEQQFTQSTIVGTVDQTAGKPTGAIIQYVSNANGQAIKYADGTLICWFKRNVSTTCSSGQYGQLFYSPYIVLTYPVPFVGDIPVVTPSCVYAGTENGVGSLGLATSQQGTLTNCTFMIQGGLANSGGRLGYMAIGRWY